MLGSTSLAAEPLGAPLDSDSLAGRASARTVAGPSVAPRGVAGASMQQRGV